MSKYQIVINFDVIEGISNVAYGRNDLGEPEPMRGDYALSVLKFVRSALGTWGDGTRFKTKLSVRVRED